MDELDLGTTIRGFSPGQRVFSRYTLKKLLGRGGMGVVWLARDEELGAELALKFLPEVVAADRGAIEDLKREVRAALNLSHSHIVKIMGFLTDGRTVAVAMEYVPGDTLANLRFERPGRVFAVAEIAPWLQQLCGALDYAHLKARIVHRDLKPANLMVDAANELKVLDFGIAATLHDSVSRVSLRSSSSGSPPYMSPQQLDGIAPSPADDIYALGATVYELLTGKPPFHAGGLAGIINQIKQVVPPPMAARRRELGVEAGDVIPPAWEDAVAACLSKEAAGRPRSAGELAAKLREAPQRLTPPPTPPAEPRRIATVEDEAAAGSGGMTRQGRAVLFVVGAAVAVLCLVFFTGPSSPEAPMAVAEVPSGPPASPEPVSSAVAAPSGSEPTQAPPATPELSLAAPDGQDVWAAFGRIVAESSKLRELRLDAAETEALVRGFARGLRGQANEPERTPQPEMAALFDRRTADRLAPVTDRSPSTNLVLEAHGERSAHEWTGELQLTEAEAASVLTGFAWEASGRRWPGDTEALAPELTKALEHKRAAKQGQLRAQNLAAAQSHFTQLKENRAVQELPSGLRYEILREGTGPFPGPTQTVKVHYVGSFIDGVVFDSSIERGTPVELRLDGTIPGFAEGVAKIRVGGKIRLHVPAALAYGDEGAPGRIPPGATLIFEVELLEVKDAP